MSIHIDRLKFLLLERTQSALSNMSGIPQSTISKVVRGISALPKKYELTLRRHFERDAYQRLRREGASVSQANRFKWMTSAKILDTMDIYQEKVKMTMEGWFTIQEQILGKSFTDSEKSYLQNLMKGKIVRGYQRSDKPVEMIQLYGQSEYLDEDELEEI